jgi:hypothetical protein
MKKTLSSQVSTLIAAILFIAVGCQQDPLPTVKDPILVKLTREQYLDSLCQNNKGLDPLWMIDSTVVKGSMGWVVTDSLSFNALNPIVDQSSKYIVSQIGYFDQFSPDKFKYAVFTPSYRFITLRAADSISQFGALTGDTTLIVTLFDIKQVSRTLPSNMDDFERENFTWYFPHRNTNEKEILDSFLREYRPMDGYWVGGHAQSYHWRDTFFENFYNHPSYKTWRFCNTTMIDYENFYQYVFKSGKYDPDPDGGLYKTIFRDELNGAKDDPYMEIRKQTLLDGREHRVMFLKIPYSRVTRMPIVTGFVRLRYVLD